MELKVQYPQFDGSQSCASIPSEMYFSTGDAEYDTRLELLKICESCKFLDECREWAIVNEEFGIWGGTTGLTRSIARKKRGIKLEWLREKNSQMINNHLDL
jgi:hypothetical protein